MTSEVDRGDEVHGVWALYMGLMFLGNLHILNDNRWNLHDGRTRTRPGIGMSHESHIVTILLLPKCLVQRLQRELPNSPPL